MDKSIPGRVSQKPKLLAATEAFLTMGIGWLAAGIVRDITLLTGSYSHKNLGGPFFECTIGLMCNAAILS